jgi:hypothetical protein
MIRAKAKAFLAKAQNRRGRKGKELPHGGSSRLAVFAREGLFFHVF